VPYNHSDEVSWPFIDSSYDKFKLLNKDLKLGEFISLFRNTMEISLSVLHPVRGFIQFKLQTQKTQIKERQK